MKNLFFLMIMLLSIFACSDSESDQADPIIGFWVGTITQPGFGTSELSVTVNQLIEDELSAELFSEVTDISQCDEELFYCELGSCSTTWIFRGRSGSLYYFFEDAPDNSSCGDGNISAMILASGELSFTWTDITDPTNTSKSILSRVN